MRLIDALKVEGNKIKIPNSSRNDLPEFFKEMGYKLGAEIGVFKGEFSKRLCDAGLKIYGIDPYLAYSAYPHPRGQERVHFIYEHAKRVLKPFTDNGQYEFIRKMSMDAVGDFKDESLDFVYIDGIHTFRYIAEDLFEWTKKVRKGGIVSGHDYVHAPEEKWTAIHVKHILDAYISCFGINTYYILDGANTNRPVRGKDKISSWFFLRA
jgi:SAM-dependent methyltransferase